MEKLFRKQLLTFPIAITGILAIILIITSIILQRKSISPITTKNKAHIVYQKDSSQKEKGNKESNSSEQKQKNNIISEFHSTPTPTIGNTQQKNSSTPTPTTPQQTPIPTQTPSPTVATHQVTLAINDAQSFIVTIFEGANQCDVLTEALAQGKIGSLNMRYDNGLGSYGVYQINGIGKENSVWWTYTVNGKSPSQGCSYIKVNNADIIVWKYIGS